MTNTVNVAVIQASPVFNDLSTSLEKATRLIAEAAAGGTKLVVFGECWLGGYPARHGSTIIQMPHYGITIQQNVFTLKCGKTALSLEAAKPTSGKCRPEQQSYDRHRRKRES